MANSKNLISNSQRTSEELRTMGKAGGIASGISRRRNRSMKEAAITLLSLPVQDEGKWNQMAAMGLEPDEIDYRMEILISLLRAATTGDSRAAKVLLELAETGERVNEQQVVIVDDL